MNTVKILTFTALFPNNVWPTQGVFIKERMRAVSQLEGVAVRVVAPVPYYPPVKLGCRQDYRRVVKEEVIDGITVTHPRYLMTPKVGMSLYGLSLCLSVLPHVRKIQRSFDFDVIDSHFLYPDGFAAVLLGKLFRKPVTISARGSDVNVYKDLSLIPYLLRFALRRADRVIAVSQALATTIQGLGIAGEKMVVVPNGVDHTRFYQEPQADARGRLGLGEGQTILSIGHLTANKGFDILIRALRLLQERGSDRRITLILVGEGPKRDELENLAGNLGLADWVQFVGAVPHDRLRAWYNAADVFCLASEREGWPNVVTEALACGTPVVATTAGGIPEIVHAPHLGMLTDRTPQAFAEALELALACPWDRAAIAQEGQKRGWHQTAQDVVKVFEAIGTTHHRACSAQLAGQAGTGWPGGKS